MKIGLVGFAGSGKTTVFNAMTGLNVPVGIGGDIRLGTVKVPDDRIDTLGSIFSPKKTTYAEMRFCDIPGEYGADKKGLSPRALQQIRDQEATWKIRPHSLKILASKGLRSLDSLGPPTLF